MHTVTTNNLYIFHSHLPPPIDLTKITFVVESVLPVTLLLSLLVKLHAEFTFYFTYCPLIAIKVMKLWTYTQHKK